MSFNYEDLIPDSIKEKFLEDDSKPGAPAQQQVPRIIMPSTISMDSSHGQFAPNPTVVVIPTTNPLYNDLRARTAFETTPIGKQLQDLMEALSDSGMTEEQKIKTALKIGHITPESVVDALNGVMQLLVADKQKFDAQMLSATTSEVDGRQQAVAQLNSHIADLESQLNAARQQKTSLEAEVGVKASKIQSLRSDYASAYDLRNADIAQMITHYQQISIQGKS